MTRCVTLTCAPSGQRRPGILTRCWASLTSVSAFLARRTLPPSVTEASATNVSHMEGLRIGLSGGGEMAGGAMRRRQLDTGRRRGADRRRHRAAPSETAAAVWADARVARQRRRAKALLRDEARRCGEQALRVGMPRPGEDFRRG